MKAVPQEDLDEIVARVGDGWSRQFSGGARILITGASGFVGGWMLDSLQRARESHALDVRVAVTTRDRAHLIARRPYLDGVSWAEIIVGDVRTLEVAGPLTHVIHCASAVDPSEGDRDPDGVADLIARGTARVVSAARGAGATRMLHMSSGAVHRSPLAAPTLDAHRASVGRAAGTAVGATVGAKAAEGVPNADLFAHAKRLAEAIALRGGGADSLAVVAARCFALLGPGLPLDGQFAAGNFVRDLLTGGPIAVRGDGRPIRTYLHPVDLATWCWRLLLDAPGGSAWDVGGTEAVSIRELATRIATHRPGVAVKVTGVVGQGEPDRYVPDVRPSAQALGFVPRIGLDEALRRMIAWYSA